MSWKSCWNNYDNFEVAFVKLLINTLVPKKKRPLKEIPNWTNTYVWRVICIPLICDARRQAMWDSAHAWEVHCWKQHEASHLTLLYFLICFNAEGGWVHCLSPCITDQWNANYPSYVSIRLIWNSISCSATESRQYETSKQDDERSIAIQFLNGCTKPKLLHIPLIILKFTYNKCNKVKIY